MDSSFPARIRIMQIIAGALLMGVVIFAGIAIFIVRNRDSLRALDAPPYLTLMAGLMLLSNVPLSFIIPRFTVRALLQRLAAQPRSLGTTREETEANLRASLLAGRQTAMIVGLALLEGAAFLGCIAYLQEGQLYSLGFVLVAACLMLWNFPTTNSVNDWLDHHQRLLEELQGAEGQLR